MNSAGFRLEKVTIEGFKAFTQPRTIPVNSKHSFILGPNGSGKSSIIEAIVWCLFGTPPGAEVGGVTNKFYTGDCMVKLALRNSEGLWTYERRLSPGGTRARPRILDPRGEERNEKEVFPALSRLSHAAGAHIIIAQSELALRRRTDITDFELVLASYLGLDPVPILLRHLDDLLQEQKDVGEALAEEIGTAEEELRRQLQEVELSLGELLKNPPWGEGAEPTREETKIKIRTLASDVARSIGAEPPADMPQEQMLTEAQERLTQMSTARLSQLEAQLETLRCTLERAEELQQEIQNTRTKLQSLEEGLKQSKRRLVEVCGGKSLEELKAELASLETLSTQEDVRLRVLNEALAYHEAYSSTRCLVCGCNHEAEHLKAQIKNAIKEATPEQDERAKRIQALMDGISLGTDLVEKIKDFVSQIDEEHKNLEQALADLKSMLELSPDTEPDSDEIVAKLDSIRASVSAMKQLLESQGREMSAWTHRIASLRSELRFHEYRATEAKLRNHLEVGLQPTRDRYAEFEEHVETVRVMRDALDKAYNEALDKCLPWINQQMTEVFCLLTHQVSFDEIRVERQMATGGPRRVVRVGSRDDTHTYDPNSVLNGQANSALRLVPYFAFSAVQAAALKINWVLIDDPSQSFDTSHVDLFLDVLQKAASGAQIMLATHEKDLFEPRIRERFGSADFSVVNVTGFTKDAGPEFVVE